MALLNSITSQQLLAARISTQANGLLMAINSQISAMFNQIWNNPDQINLSPDKTWAALGTDAVAARQLFLGTVEFLNQAEAGSCKLVEPSNWTIVQNSDGSITATKNA